jgi:replicative DNA helicase
VTVEDVHDVLAPAPTAPPAQSVLAAERTVVGAMIGSAAATEAAAECLTAIDFYDGELKTVAQACFDLAGAGKPVDLASVHQHLAVTGQLGLFRRTGAAPLLADLFLEGCTPIPETIGHHAETITDDAVRRRIHDAGTVLRQKSNHPGFGPDDAQAAIDLVVAAAQPSIAPAAASSAVWIADDFDEFLHDLAHPEADDRIPTPWVDLNDAVAMRPGHLVVIGGRPGDGKSLAGLGIAACAAIDHGMGALIASMEMRRFEVMRRLIASRAKVELSHLEAKALTQRDWDLVEKVAEEVRAAPLAIDPASQTSIAHLRSRLRHLSKTTPIRVLVVDYLQLLKVTKKAERRDLDIAEFTRELKQIAVEFNICVIALSQLNRGSATRNDRPKMSDLREGGSIEQDADTVILLHRPSADDADGTLLGEVELIIPKQRAGQSGLTVRLAFQGHYGRLFNMRRD